MITPGTVASAQGGPAERILTKRRMLARPMNLGNFFQNVIMLAKSNAVSSRNNKLMAFRAIY
jgi:hypothetical protein